MKLRELSGLLRDAAINGTAAVMSENGIAHERITKQQAYRLYGRGTVDRWISEGLIVPIAANGGTSKKTLDSQQLAAIAAASNRITYLPVAERNR